MAANLQAAGHEVRAYDIRRVEGFPHFAASAAEAVQGCELVFTSVPGPNEVEAVAAQVKPALRPGRGVVRALDQFADARPAAACRPGEAEGAAARCAGERRRERRGKRQARHLGRAATRRSSTSTSPFCKAIGDQPLYVGAIGAGTVAKLAHNTAELRAARGARRDVHPRRQGRRRAARALPRAAPGRLAAASAPSTAWPRISCPGNTIPPTFALRLAHKDATLALELAREVGVPMPFGRARARGAVARACERGWAERDFRVALTPAGGARRRESACFGRGTASGAGRVGRS